MAHSSANLHNFLFNLNGLIPWIFRYSLCARRQSFSKSVKPIVFFAAGDGDLESRRPEFGVTDRLVPFRSNLVPFGGVEIVSDSRPLFILVFRNR